MISDNRPWSGPDTIAVAADVLADSPAGPPHALRLLHRRLQSGRGPATETVMATDCRESGYRLARSQGSRRKTFPRKYIDRGKRASLKRALHHCDGVCGDAGTEGGDAQRFWGIV
jgi:hypothetical protein